MIRPFLLALLAAPVFAQARPPAARDVAVPDPVVQRIALPAGTPEAFTVRLTHGGTELVVDLRRRALRSAAFALAVTDRDGGLREAAPPAVRTYRGTVRGRPELTVAAGLEDGALFATVVGDAGVAFVVQPASDLIPGSLPGLHVAHRPARLPVGSCGVADHGAPLERAAVVRSTTPDMPLVADLAFDCDFDFYQFKGSSVAAVVADIERTLDAVNVVYERDVGITHRVSRIVVRTSEPDPYDGNDAGAILGTQFRGEWNTNQSAVPRDMAHFVTSRAMGNILGLAYVGVVCDLGNAYGLSRFGTNFDQNASVLCHELGHNWSAPHCLDACDVMCGCGIQGGFGPNDQAQIVGFRDSLSCLRRLHPELVAHWRLDEIAGSVAQDAGPNGLGGAFVGGAVLGRAGAAAHTATAVGFDGVDDAVRILDGPGLAGLRGGFSVAAWVRASGSGGPAQRFFGNDLSWSVGTYFGRLSLTLRGRRDFRSVATLAPNRWTHVAVTADAVGVTFHVDGQRVDTIGGWVAPNPTGPAWYVGSRDGAFEWFAGDLDDVQVYDGVLTDAQVAWLYAHAGDPLCTPGAESYGTGLAGTRGTPTLAVRGLPIVGRTITLEIGSASPFIVAGVGILGVAPASLPALGGTILVDPASAVSFVQVVGPLVPIGYRVAIPNDPSLACASFYAQFAHPDAGAVQGIALTAGVRVVIGG